MSPAKGKKKTKNKSTEKIARAPVSNKDIFCTSGRGKLSRGWAEVSSADKFPRTAEVTACDASLASASKRDSSQTSRWRCARQIRCGVEEAAKEGEHAKDGWRLHKSGRKFCQWESLCVNRVAFPVHLSAQRCRTERRVTDRNIGLFAGKANPVLCCCHC